MNGEHHQFKVLIKSLKLLQSDLEKNKSYTNSTFFEYLSISCYLCIVLCGLISIYIPSSNIPGRISIGSLIAFCGTMAPIALSLAEKAKAKNSAIQYLILQIDTYLATLPSEYHSTIKSFSI
jgi:hypothetical protein